VLVVVAMRYHPWVFEIELCNCMKELNPFESDIFVLLNYGSDMSPSS